MGCFLFESLIVFQATKKMKKGNSMRAKSTDEKHFENK